MNSSNPDQPSSRPTGFERVFLSEDERLRPIFRAILFLLAGFLYVVLVIAILPPVTGMSQGARFVVAYVLIDAGLLLESWLFARALDRRSFRIVGLWFYNGWGRELALGAGFGAGLMALVVALLVAARGVSYHGWAGHAGHDLLRLTGTASLLALAAIFEELAFRGYAFQRLVEALGPLGAVVTFAAFFGAVHAKNPSATAFSIANTVLAGVLLALAYLRTRALWLPIGLHWAWNFFQGPISSFPVSGFTFGPLLFRVDSLGPVWLTGGDYGPEGGAVVTVVSLAAILWLARTRQLAPSPAMAEVLK